MKKLTLIILFMVSNLSAQEVITSSTAIMSRYLVYVSSLTAGNKNTIKTVLMNIKNNPEPSKNYHAIYNSTSTLCKFTDWNDTDLKVDLSTNRIIFEFDSGYDSTVLPWVTAGKIQKLGTLYRVIGTNNGIAFSDIRYLPLVNYTVSFYNPDWNIWVSTFDPVYGTKP